MKGLPRAARLYVALIIAAGAVAMAVRLPHVAFPNFYLFAALALLSPLASNLKLKLPLLGSSSTMSVSYAADFTALLLIGPDAAMLVAALSAWTQGTIRVEARNPVHRTLFNIASLVLTVQGAGWLYELLGGVTGQIVWPGAVSPLMAAATGYFLINTVSVAGAVALSIKQPVWSVWNQNFLWSAPAYFVGAFAAAGVAWIVLHTGIWLLPVAAAPIYLTYRTYKIYLGRIADEQRHAAEVTDLHAQAVSALNDVQHSESRLREVIESISEGMFVVERDGRIGLWNDSAERISGVLRHDVIGRTLPDAAPWLDRSPLSAALADALASGAPVALQDVVVQTPGASRVYEVRVFPFTAGATCFFSDVTDRAKAQEALRESEARYALAAEGANDGLWDWHIATGVAYFSPRWKEMIGAGADDVVTDIEAWFSRVHPEDLANLRTAIQAHLDDRTAHFEHEYRIQHSDGTYQWMLCRGLAVRTGEGPWRMAGSQTDITERHRSQEQLRHAALHDALTGLPNRALFMELLERAIAKSHQRRLEYQFAVLFLDLDRFKVVNDSLGHVVGDLFLVAIAQRLNTCIRTTDVISRLGGDEFTILLDDVAGPNDAVRVAERIHEALGPALVIGDDELYATASIGIAMGGKSYHQPEDVLRDADTAMYRAKGQGRARHQLFDASMHARAVEWLTMEMDLRRAVDRREFVLHYQPIVDLKEGVTRGFEALVRWQRPDGRMVPPGDFIPLAEETGLIVPLGEWVLNEACRQVAVWQRQFPSDPPLAVTVNVSAKQFSESGMVEKARVALEGSGLAAGSLRMELTESVLVETGESIMAVLVALRKIGIQLYLDDFGTGYSSLSYLHKFPIQTLKIDRSFVSRMGVEGENAAIVNTIVGLAHELGLNVIAEGVETADQVVHLKAIRCEHAQGFYFSKPMAAAAAEHFLSVSAVTAARTA